MARGAYCRKTQPPWQVGGKYYTTTATLKFRYTIYRLQNLRRSYTAETYIKFEMSSFAVLRFSSYVCILHLGYANQHTATVQCVPTLFGYYTFIYRSIILFRSPDDGQNISTIFIYGHDAVKVNYI
ncbi:hypothetical protein QTP88_014487 [Uroleucon formosanum]